MGDHLTPIPGARAGAAAWSLSGKPVPWGTTLELRLPGDTWVPVRLVLSVTAAPAALKLPLGYPWEVRFTAEVEPRDGGWIVWDLRWQMPVTTTARDSSPKRELLYPDAAADRYDTEDKARAQAEAMNAGRRAFYHLEIPLGVRDLEHVELRWPDQPERAPRRGRRPKAATEATTP